MSRNHDDDKELGAALRAEYRAWAETVDIPPPPTGVAGVRAPFRPRRASGMGDWLTLATAAAVLVVVLPLAADQTRTESPLGQMFVRTLQDQRAVRWGQDLVDQAGRDLRARFAPETLNE